MAKPKAKRIGLFGGSFSPVHLGHLSAAREVKRRLKLDALWFIPCAKSAYGKSLLPDALRLQCLRAAIKGKPGYEVLDLEIKRGGVSRTVQTLRELRGLHPAASFFFLIGSDQVSRLSQWKEVEQLPALARLVLLARPGYRPPAKAVRKWNILSLEIPQYEISSTQIRHFLAKGEDIAWLVPESVQKILSKS